MASSSGGGFSGLWNGRVNFPDFDNAFEPQEPPARQDATDSNLTSLDLSAIEAAEGEPMRTPIVAAHAQASQTPTRSRTMAAAVPSPAPFLSVQPVASGQRAKDQEEDEEDDFFANLSIDTLAKLNHTDFAGDRRLATHPSSDPLEEAARLAEEEAECERFFRERQWEVDLSPVRMQPPPPLYDPVTERFPHKPQTFITQRGDSRTYSDDSLDPMEEREVKKDESMSSTISSTGFPTEASPIRMAPTAPPTMPLPPSPVGAFVGGDARSSIGKLGQLQAMKKAPVKRSLLSQLSSSAVNAGLRSPARTVAHAVQIPVVAKLMMSPAKAKKQIVSPEKLQTPEKRTPSSAHSPSRSPAPLHPGRASYLTPNSRNLAIRRRSPSPAKRTASPKKAIVIALRKGGHSPMRPIRKRKQRRESRSPSPNKKQGDTSEPPLAQEASAASGSGLVLRSRSPASVAAQMTTYIIRTRSAGEDVVGKEVAAATELATAEPVLDVSPPSDPPTALAVSAEDSVLGNSNVESPAKVSREETSAEFEPFSLSFSPIKGSGGESKEEEEEEDNVVQHAPEEEPPTRPSVHDVLQDVSRALSEEEPSQLEPLPLFERLPLEKDPEQEAFGRAEAELLPPPREPERQPAVRVVVEDTSKTEEAYAEEEPMEVAPAAHRGPVAVAALPAPSDTATTVVGVAATVAKSLATTRQATPETQVAAQEMTSVRRKVHFMDDDALPSEAQEEEEQDGTEDSAAAVYAAMANPTEETEDMSTLHSMALLQSTLLEAPPSDEDKEEASPPAPTQSTGAGLEPPSWMETEVVRAVEVEPVDMSSLDAATQTSPSKDAGPFAATHRTPTVSPSRYTAGIDFARHLDPKNDAAAQWLPRPLPRPAWMQDGRRAWGGKPAGLDGETLLSLYDTPSSRHSNFWKRKYLERTLRLFALSAPEHTTLRPVSSVLSQWLPQLRAEVLAASHGPRPTDPSPVYLRSALFANAGSLLFESPRKRAPRPRSVSPIQNARASRQQGLLIDVPGGVGADTRLARLVGHGRMANGVERLSWQGYCRLFGASHGSMTATAALLPEEGTSRRGRRRWSVS